MASTPGQEGDAERAFAERKATDAAIPLAQAPRRGRSQGPSIGDYALIGDGRTAALVSRDGSIDWLCLPHFAGPSVVARLLDPLGGAFLVQPDAPFTTRRRYLPGTAVLETTFTTAGGTARLLDLLPVGDDVRRLRPLLGGWVFAFVYFALFRIMGIAGVPAGAGLGLVHGVFLLACLMPLLPYLHPRMASEHHGVTAMRLLEPPGFFAVNYGRRTAAVLLAAQAV